VICVEFPNARRYLSLRFLRRRLFPDSSVLDEVDSGPPALPCPCSLPGKAARIIDDDTKARFAINPKIIILIATAIPKCNGIAIAGQRGASNVAKSRQSRRFPKKASHTTCMKLMPARNGHIYSRRRASARVMTLTLRPSKQNSPVAPKSPMRRMPSRA